MSSWSLSCFCGCHLEAFEAPPQVQRNHDVTGGGRFFFKNSPDPHFSWHFERNTEAGCRHAWHRPEAGDVGFDTRRASTREHAPASAPDWPRRGRLQPPMNQPVHSLLALGADADYAVQTTELARSQIIQQASTAMLAQANQSFQGVLALLRPT